MLSIFTIFFSHVMSTNTPNQNTQTPGKCTTTPTTTTPGTDYVTKAQLVDVLKNFASNDLKKMIDSNVQSVESDLTTQMAGLNDQIKDLKNLITNLGNNKSTTNPYNTHDSAFPLPGNIDDYMNAILPIILGSSRCNNCCTCAKKEACMYNLFIQLQVIVGKNSSWTPPNMFLLNQFNTFNIQGSNNDNRVMIIQMMLTNLGKIRCKNCKLCKQIEGNFKISFMLNPNILSNLPGFGNSSNTSSKELMMALMSMNGGTLNPNLLSLFMGNNSSAQGCNCGTNTNKCPSQNKCPTSGQGNNKCPTQNKCPTSGQGNNICPSQNKCSSNIIPSCNNGNTIQPRIATPFMDPRGPSIVYGLLPGNPNTNDPSYGVQPDNPNTNDPSYGVQPDDSNNDDTSYGVKPDTNRPDPSTPAYGLRYGDY